MVWPFGPSESTKKSGNSDNASSQLSSWSNPLEWSTSDLSTAAKEWTPVVVTSLAGLGALRLYKTYLRRIPGAAFVRPSFFHKRSVFGKVTSVGDGDGFHLFHTPGGKAVGWGWLRKVPSKRKELKDQTIPIRLAGVDAPEGAHFGKPAQPFAAEALQWLTGYILHRNVRARVYKRDQYNRIVATVFVRRWFIRRDVGLEMLKRGLATTYEGKSDVEWGGRQALYEKAVAKAKKKRKGMWAGKASEYESPGEYKKRWSGVDNSNSAG